MFRPKFCHSGAGACAPERRFFMVMISLNGRTVADASDEKKCRRYSLHRTTVTDACVEVSQRLGEVAEIFLEGFNIRFEDADLNPNMEHVIVDVTLVDRIGVKHVHPMEFDIGPFCKPDIDYMVFASEMLGEHGLSDYIGRLMIPNSKGHRRILAQEG